MEIQAIKNLKPAIKKLFFQNCKSSRSAEPVLLNNLDLKDISLEKNPLADIFQKQNYSHVLSGIKNNPHKTVLANAFLKNNPMNEETYAKLSPIWLSTIRAQLTPDLVEEAESLLTVSKIIKRFFDEKYGENQYEFVSIGRSLSALANCLSFMGVKTNQIPLSGCGGRRRNITDTIKTITEQVFGFDEYKNFLEETLNSKTNKKHLFFDYADTGKTLKVFETLLKHPKVNLYSEEDEFLAINQFLMKDVNYKNNEDYRNVIKIFNEMLRFQLYDNYAEIKPLGFRNLKKLPYSLQPTDLIQNRLMKFCILDMLKTSKSMK